MPSWFPGTYFGNVAHAQSKWIRKLQEDPVDYVQEAMVSIPERESFRNHDKIPGYPETKLL